MFTVANENTADKISTLRLKYNDTFIQAKAIICKHVPVERLKEQICCQWLSTEAQEAKTSDQLMESFWRQSCTFPFLHELVMLVDALGIGNAQRIVAEYEEMREKVCREMLVEDFAKLALEEEYHEKDVQVLNTFITTCKNFGKCVFCLFVRVLV